MGSTQSFAAQCISDRYAGHSVSSLRLRQCQLLICWTSDFFDSEPRDTAAKPLSHHAMSSGCDWCLSMELVPKTLWCDYLVRRFLAMDAISVNTTKYTGAL